MTRKIGPDNGFPTEMPTEPPYRDTVTKVEDADECSVRPYDHVAQGDYIDLSERQRKVLQISGLIGSALVGSISSINIAATQFALDRIDDPALEIPLRLAQFGNMAATFCAYIFGALCAIGLTEQNKY